MSVLACAEHLGRTVPEPGDAIPPVPAAPQAVDGLRRRGDVVTVRHAEVLCRLSPSTASGTPRSPAGRGMCRSSGTVAIWGDGRVGAVGALAGCGDPTVLADQFDSMLGRARARPACCPRPGCGTGARPGCTRSPWAPPRSGSDGTRCCPTGTINPGEMTSFNHYALGRRRRLDAPHHRGPRGPWNPATATVLIAPRHRRRPPGWMSPSRTAHRRSSGCRRAGPNPCRRAGTDGPSRFRASPGPWDRT